MNGPTVGELFAGAGGIGMGVKAIWPDATVAWVSDIKPGACKVLAHRFPDAPNLGDITKIDWANVEPVDIITGGSPCQDLSHAGKRMGMKKGTRSGLWASMLEGIKALRPSLVIWENVRGAFSAEADSSLEPCPGCLGIDDDTVVLRALGRVLGDLADVGYDAAWVGLRAADVGAAHGRYRVFVLAWPADADGAGVDQWRHSGSGQATGGRSLADHRGRGGAPLALLRTPMEDEDGGGPLHPDVARERGQTLRLTGQILAMTGDLLPTPQVHDQVDGKTAAQVKAMRERTGAGVWNLNEVVVNDLLPTPALNDMGAGKTVEAWDEWTDAMKARHGNGNGHGKSLSIEAARLLPTPEAARAGGTRERHLERKRIADGSTRTVVTNLDVLANDATEAIFGQYAPAIARWEAVLDREAPAPVEPTGKNGANRLSARFVEFMMGWPAGWVTEVPDVTRNEALSICGDGVVPAQCAEAVRHLLDVRAQFARTTA